MNQVGRAHSSFISISRNEEKVVIANAKTVAYHDLTTIPTQTHTLATNTNLITTSCAISGNGNRCITTHYPAQVRFWCTKSNLNEDNEEPLHPLTSIENFYPVTSLSWINTEGTLAIAIFTNDEYSYEFQFNWKHLSTNIETRCEKLRNCIRGLAISEKRNIAILLEPNVGIVESYHRITVQKLCDIGTNKLIESFGFINALHLPLRVCVAELTAEIFVQVGDEIRVYQSHHNNHYYSCEPCHILDVQNEILCDVSEDGTRVLTCSSEMRFNVWYVPTCTSIVRYLGACQLNFIPLLSRCGDVVYYADHMNNLWKVSIGGRFLSNLLNNHTLPRGLMMTRFNDPYLPNPIMNYQLLTRFNSVSSHDQLHHQLIRGTQQVNDEDLKTMELAILSIRNLVSVKANSSSPCSTINYGKDWMMHMQEIEKELAKLSMVLSSKKVSDDDAICVIDREVLRKGDKVICLPCDHIFHYDCVYSYLNNSEIAKCPLCRHQVSNEFGLQHLVWEWKNDSTDTNKLWSNNVTRSNNNTTE